MKSKKRQTQIWLRAVERARKYASTWGRQMPRRDHEVELLEDCWERAGKRIRRLDPNRSRARIVMRELVKKS